MRKIGSIYARDIRNIATNWVAAVIILGLVFLPSLYAWFNIEASWDPYGQTGGIAIAVANNDEGATLRGKQLNLGNEIVASLKKNEKIGWTFVDEKEAMKGVNHGEYYASIIIPADFSAKIATVLTDDPQKADILYYVNEKINAVSPKITSKGATGVIDEVSRNFIKVANGTIFQIFNEIGVELENELPTIEKVKTLVFKLETVFPELNQAVGVALDDVHKSNDIVKKAQDNLPIVTQLAKDGEEFTNKLGDFLGKGSEAVEALGPNIKQDLLLLQQTATATQELTGILKDANFDPAVAKAAIDRVSQRLTVAVDVTDRMIGLFEQLNKYTGGKVMPFVIDRLKSVKDRFQQQLTTVGKIRDAIDKGEKPAQELVDNLNRLSKETAGFIGDILGRYDSEIQPQILQGIAKAKKTAQNAHTVLSEAVKSIPDLQKILGDAAKGLAVGDKELKEIQARLPEAETKIKDLADKIRAFEKEGNLTELIDLLKNNFEKESEFFAEPVQLKENKLFPIPNYGSAMSPFFTTLSLWVGALLLVSLLTVEVHEPGYKSYQVFFGRYLTFGTLAVMQSLMVTLGDMFILKTYVVDKLWFVLFGMVLSAVFMLIVYTLVSVFGNVGKAMAIVLLVLQLAGSGGTFPIQVTPPFFQAIHPYLPFTYGISMMREAVGGILWDIIMEDLVMMAIYIGITLLIGLALKKVINKSSAKFISRAKESKLIH
ncbi:YhgE/Pip domain-containing protein [Paenibacillus chitinolyticus]|uniref:YhgE/Pip domain-containing protein n=1 Tax=Paenibacillus chitinolyticus TaxID=79263 RepID=A0A410WPG7_9BACL|nr:YhgE/Pip domain-containing protein [Paenibacillus chitinolyticus]MCY9590806.1 YhgE/Pip domain-containing protein [Paenibacillus chitinolyticus]MCY9598713.1 YhgE/Pip domain-containing protein [Paenibacillus chitinolyticus]QAV16255.1 YhgE/Pip domain-containing protein [Paenibacillus chitinolyticus]